MWDRNARLASVYCAIDGLICWLWLIGLVFSVPHPKIFKKITFLNLSNSHSAMNENWYRKNHQKLLYLTFIIFIISLGVIYVHNNTHGDFIKKDISLAGGTSVTIETSQAIDVIQLESSLQNQLEDVSVRVLTDPTSRSQQGIIIVTSNTDTDMILSLLGSLIVFEESDVSLESTGPTLGASFFKDLVTTLIIAFILMGLSVFIAFRNFTPSIAVILAAVMDITITIAIVDLLGIKVAAGGIVALLLIIGYSIDTDVLLTTKMLKQGEGSSFERIKSAMKTGLTMTFTTLIALIIAYFVSFHPLLKQIFLIIIIALVIDILITYGMNASILYRYVEKKK